MADNIITYVVVFGSAVIAVEASRKKGLTYKGKADAVLKICDSLGKGKIIVGLVALVGVFLCMNYYSAVTYDEIIYHSILRPNGVVYRYEDVDSISTGFSKDGDFYYSIYVDNQSIRFDMPVVNDNIDRYKDSYLELEEFDDTLLKRNPDINKVSSDQHYKKCDYAKRYVNRFLRIIANMPQSV